MGTNTFKNAQGTNITSVTSIYTAPSLNTSILLELDIANTTTAVVETSVQVTDTSASSTSYLVKDAPIPVGSSLELLTGGKVILETTDVLRVDCSVADKLSGTLSIMEIT